VAYAIRFDYPEGTVYAGEYKGGLGWAPTLRTALLFPDAEVAGRMLANGYGASVEFGRIVEVKDEEVTA
jgi:hypothetical protein